MPWRRNRLPTPVVLSFPGSSAGKESACNEGDLGSIPGLERSPGEGNTNPLQYSCLENSMDRRIWWATVHGVAKSQTWLDDFHFHNFWPTCLCHKMNHDEQFCCLGLLIWLIAVYSVANIILTYLLECLSYQNLNFHIIELKNCTLKIFQE